jgi:hypothetical protein
VRGHGVMGKVIAAQKRSTAATARGARPRRWCRGPAHGRGRCSLAAAVSYSAHARRAGTSPMLPAASAGEVRSALLQRAGRAGAAAPCRGSSCTAAAANKGFDAASRAGSRPHSPSPPAPAPVTRGARKSRAPRDDRRASRTAATGQCPRLRTASGAAHRRIAGLSPLGALPRRPRQDGSFVDTIPGTLFLPPSAGSVARRVTHRR